MASGIEVMAWNTCDGFSDPSIRLDIIDAMLYSKVSNGYGFVDLEPDVIAVSEAFSATNSNKLEDDFGNVAGLFDAEGYRAKMVRYNDKDDRPDKHAFMMLSRLPGSLFLKNYMGSRTTLKVIAVDPSTGGAMEIDGVHLDDRTLGGRLLQIMNLTYSAQSDTSPTGNTGLGLPRAIIGDFNAMHADDPKARLWRNSLIRTLAYSVKAGEPGTEQSKIARAASIGQRLCDMADPSVMRQLIAAGYKDADPTFSPTFNSKRPFIQLDHIMTNPGFDVDRFDVHPHTGLSDHRAISARLITATSVWS